MPFLVGYGQCDVHYAKDRARQRSDSGKFAYPPGEDETRRVAHRSADTILQSFREYIYPSAG